ncbi:MAG: TIGR03986 family CRISPR-associated RAMP protein, partial [Oscillospiraceae bacterium]|nr:TIGR03986 family CRISPR-associated RAMP protein [Oscillospiraceae bacterium]
MAYKWEKWEPDRKDENNKFINPYNFVPLGEICEKGEKKSVLPDEKLITGQIKCEITLKTDLFVPNTSNDLAFDVHAKDEDDVNYHKSYDFFSYTNLDGKKAGESGPEKPVIPGSEIRGVMRSVFETLTDSCLNMDYDQPIFTRTPKAKNPGVLYYNPTSNRWELYMAENVRLNRGTSLETGDIVKFKAKKYKTVKPARPPKNQETIIYTYSVVGNTTKEPTNTNIKNNEQLIKLTYDAQNITDNHNYGIVLIGEKTAQSTKKYEHIFRICNSNPVEFGEKVEKGINNLKKVLESYRDETVNQHKKTGEHSGYKNYTLKDKTIYPVYYEKYNGNYYFSPACISKNVYYNTLGNMVKNKNYEPCNDKNNLCPACSLFGTVAEGKNNFALASRLRFSDASYCGEMPPQYHTAVTIRELAEPKFRCFEFYMINEQDSLKSAFDIEKKDVTIRGRKFYLHHDKVSYEKIEPSKLNCTIRPLLKKENAKFCFDVFFDKISEKELQQILTVLSNGNNNAENLCHKIGKAKPLGFGSIKVKVNEVLVRNIRSKEFAENKTDDYRDYFSGKIPWDKIFSSDQNVIDSYKRIIDLKTTEDKLVSYPKAKNYDYEAEINPQKRKEKEELSEVSYQWFIGNRRLGAGASEMNWIIDKPLPSILDKNLELTPLKKVDDSTGRR